MPFIGDLDPCISDPLRSFKLNICNTYAYTISNQIGLRLGLRLGLGLGLYERTIYTYRTVCSAVRITVRSVPLDP